MRSLIALLCITCTCAYPSPEKYQNNSEKKEMTGIEIILPKTEFIVDDEIPVMCVALFNDGTRKELEYELVNWKCSDEAVCTIDYNKVRAVGRGSTMLMAYAETFTDAKAITVTTPPDYSKILISEIYYDPALLADAEFIELWNTSDEDIDIGGCVISEGGNLYSYTFPSSTVISAGMKIVLPRKIESFFQEFSFYPQLPSSGITLGNSGETVILKKPDGAIIDIVFLEGGDEKFPQPPEWCASKLPNASKGCSASRISHENSKTCTDWTSGKPSPGE